MTDEQKDQSVEAFEDPTHEGNSEKHHTGVACIEKGCNEAAGTWWSPYWCFKCNVERMKRIDSQMREMVRGNVE